MSTDTESTDWYLTDSNVNEKDSLAAVVKTVMKALDHPEFPDFPSGYSNRVFNDRWKAGLSVLKEFLDVPYGDLVKSLPSFYGVLEMGCAERIPHKDTLRKFSGRLPEGLLDTILGETARLLCGPDIVTALDSTGMSESNASRHFVKRSRQPGVEVVSVRDLAKVTLATDTRSLAILACDVAGSRAADVKRFAPTPEPVNDAGIVPSAILVDRGYDAEPSHVDAGRTLGDDVVTMIPVRATKHPKSARSGGRTNPGGQYRRRVYRGFDEDLHSYRSLVETVSPMIKRKMGDTVFGKTESSMAREMKFACIAHNVRLLIDSGSVRI